MKKYICTALTLLLAASLFVGCGCTNRNVSDHPGGKITDPTGATSPIPTMTEPATHETARPSTAPTHENTVPTTGATHSTEATTGILPDASQPMPGTTEAAPGGTTVGARSGSRNSMRP